MNLQLGFGFEPGVTWRKTEEKQDEQESEAEFTVTSDCSGRMIQKNNDD
jgi:hypothetical protein